MIASDTSSKGQIERLIEILRYIQMRHNNNQLTNEIGDFNFDFNTKKELNILKETLRKSAKKQVKEAEYLIATLEPLYGYINEKEFYTFP